MSKCFEVGILLDYYGAILTEEQYNIADMYYNQDLSLQEISENVGITRQGVYDKIKRIESFLIELESKLKVKFVFDKIGSVGDDILKVITDLKSKAGEAELLSKMELLTKEILKTVG